ncbi:MAG: ferrochelatase, partial [bacterium]
MPTRKTGILLCNFGGPRTGAEIPRVLFDLFNDPDIFQVWGGPIVQKALAWLISYLRTYKVQSAYARIGGASPLVAITHQQADGLRELLRHRGLDLPIAIGMRYGLPSMEEAIRELQRQAVEHILLVPLYPHYSLSTVGSTINAMRRLMEGRSISWDTLPQ